MGKYVIGLDLGETSVGWAVVEESKSGPRKIIDVGARVFPAGANVDEKRGSAETENQKRRGFRSSRRVIRRRSNRKFRLKTILIDAGFLPKNEKKLAEIFQLCPYELRAKAIQKKLKPYELGRALYHLCQRRGFKSNRKSDKDEKEAGKVKTGIASLSRAIKETGSITLGHHYYQLKMENADPEKKGEALRNRMGRYDRHPSRAMIEEEFNIIWTTQSKYHKNKLTEKLKEDVHNAIFFQETYELTEERMSKMPSRANAHRAPHLAKCPLFPDEYRSPAGTWIAQRFRLLKEINNLRLIDENVKSHELTSEQRALLLNRLDKRKEATFKSLRKDLNLREGLTFNLEEGKRDRIKGNEVEQKIIKAIFGSLTKKVDRQWDEYSEDVKNEIRHAVETIEDEDQFFSLKDKWGFGSEQMEKLHMISPSGGYLAYSEKVIRILVGLMEDGLDEYHAIEKARQKDWIPKSIEPDCYDLLPAPPDLPNPIVTRALYETRKVVNALIRKYGKPGRVAVELAREVKDSPKRRQSSIEFRAENEARNRVARKWYEERGLSKPNRDDLIKYKLWEDQKHLCAYTGKTISEKALRASETIVEIDHIIPYSRCMDDSYMNKVLCLAQANREKGNKTPVEWYGGEGNPKFDKMITRLTKMNTHRRKMDFFRLTEVQQDKMVARQLVDSQYISREVTKYLQCLFEPKARVEDKNGKKRPVEKKVVWTVKGKTTSDLRHYWGLNTIIGPDNEKDRTDHRHHTIDAIVIACAKQKHAKDLMESTLRGYHLRDVDPPWKNFRDDVKHMVIDRERTWILDGQEVSTKGVIVSHRVDRKIKGGFHKATNYGPTKEKNEFVRRVKLESLSMSMVWKIRDPAIQEIVLQRLRECGVDTGQKKAKIPRDAFQKPLSMPSGMPIRKVRVLDVIEQPVLFASKDGDTYRAAISGNNHHVEIVEVENGGKETKWQGVFVPMMEAANRVRRLNQPLIKRDHGPDKRLVMSLGRNEMVFMKDGDSAFKLLRVQKMSVTGVIIFRPHTYAGPLKNTDKPPIIIRKSPNTLNGIVLKVAVSPLGEISPTHD